MAKVLEMPKLSPTMEEGVLSAWHKKAGDSVAVDDLLAEVETDKATMKFRAFDSGTLLKLLVEPGATVKLGQPVAVLGNPGEDISGLATASSAAPRAEPAAQTTAEAKAPVAPAAPAAGATEPPKAEAPPPPKPAPRATSGAQRDPLTRTEHLPERVASASAQASGRVLASPYVRKTARDQGLDLTQAHGTGPGGRITADDLKGLRANGSAVPAPTNGQERALAPARKGAEMTLPGLVPPEAHPLSMMRKTIARRLTEAKQTVPHFYLTIDVNADELASIREWINDELAAGAPKWKGDGESTPPMKVSVNDLLIKACAVALTRVPQCNAQFTPDALLFHKRVDISVAVAIPDGLVTPVVRDADQKSVVAIAHEVRDLAARARQKKLSPEEMSQGTFSISNLGMFGIDAFAAVINPPEGAILAVGQVREEPVVREGAVVVGKKLALTLSCDHRVVDGAVGAAFLAELRSLLERPMRVLVG